jgi:hypothetical protein
MIYPTLELATQALAWLRDRHRVIGEMAKGDY